MLSAVRLPSPAGRPNLTRRRRMKTAFTKLRGAAHQTRQTFHHLQWRALTSPVAVEDRRTGGEAAGSSLTVWPATLGSSAVRNRSDRMPNSSD